MICRGLDFLRSHIWKTFPFYKTTKSTTFPKGKNQPRNEKSFQYNRIWLQMMEVHSSLTATERMQQLFPCLLIPRIHAMFSLSSLCSCASPRELAQTAKPAESIKAKEEGKGRVFSQINKLNQPMRKLWQWAQDLRVQTEDSRTKKSGMEAGPPFHIPRTTRPVELYSLTDPTDWWGKSVFIQRKSYLRVAFNHAMSFLEVLHWA